MKILSATLLATAIILGITTLQAEEYRLIGLAAAEKTANNSKAHPVLVGIFISYLNFHNALKKTVPPALLKIDAISHFRHLVESGIDILDSETDSELNKRTAELYRLSMEILKNVNNTYDVRVRTKIASARISCILYINQPELCFPGLFELTGR